MTKKTPLVPKSPVLPKAEQPEEIRPTNLAAAPADKQLGADQVVQILADCIPRSGGNQNEIVMAKTIQSYGFALEHEVDVLTSFIIGNADFGVRKYGFRLAGDALNFVTPTTVLGDLADAIEDKATPAP